MRGVPLLAVVFALSSMPGASAVDAGGVECGDQWGGGLVVSTGSSSLTCHSSRTRVLFWAARICDFFACPPETPITLRVLVCGEAPDRGILQWGLSSGFQGAVDLAMIGPSSTCEPQDALRIDVPYVAALHEPMLANQIASASAVWMTGEASGVLAVADPVQIENE